MNETVKETTAATQAAPSPAPIAKQKRVRPTAEQLQKISRGGDYTFDAKKGDFVQTRKPTTSA